MCCSFRRDRRRERRAVRTSGPPATPSLRSHDRVQVPRVSSQGRTVADGGPTPRLSRESSPAAELRCALPSCRDFARLRLAARFAAASVSAVRRSRQRLGRSLGRWLRPQHRAVRPERAGRAAGSLEDLPGGRRARRRRQALRGEMPPAQRARRPAGAGRRRAAHRHDPHRARTLAARVPSGAVLFLIARTGGGGPPTAVRRIADPSFPLEFSIGPEDRMLAGAARSTAPSSSWRASTPTATR